MNITKTKLIAISAIFLPAVLLTIMTGTPNAQAVANPEEPAAVYKTKCAACHSPAAAKFYDPAKPEAEQVDAILKGKKGEKPPYMPAYGDKGITEEGAKALVTYMKGLRSAT